MEPKSFRCLAYCGTAIFIAFIASCQTTNYQIRKTIEAGATPMAAVCALVATPTTDCVLVFHAEAVEASQ